jgi:hypothetical protein
MEKINLRTCSDAALKSLADGMVARQDTSPKAMLKQRRAILAYFDNVFKTQTPNPDILSKKIPVAYHIPCTEYSLRKKAIIEDIRSKYPTMFDDHESVEEIFLSVFYLDCSEDVSLERQYIWMIDETDFCLFKEGDTAKIIHTDEARHMLMSSVRKILELLAMSDDPEDDFPGRDKIKKILASGGTHFWWDKNDTELMWGDITECLPSLSMPIL